MPRPAVAHVPMAVRPSGLIVPDDLATVPEQGRTGPILAHDLDGRRRVVYTDEDRRLIDRVIKLLDQQGFGIIVGCRSRLHVSGHKACGQVMAPEGAGTADPGFGCQCSRIHWMP